MKYKCLNCNETYDEKYIALKCCYDPAQRYLCGICNKMYYNYETARYCCAEDKVEEVDDLTAAEPSASQLIAEFLEKHKWQN